MLVLIQLHKISKASMFLIRSYDLLINPWNGTYTLDSINDNIPKKFALFLFEYFALSLAANCTYINTHTPQRNNIHIIHILDNESTTFWKQEFVNKAHKTTEHIAIENQTDPNNKHSNSSFS